MRILSSGRHIGIHSDVTLVTYMLVKADLRDRCPCVVRVLIDALQVFAIIWHVPFRGTAQVLTVHPSPSLLIHSPVPSLGSTDVKMTAHFAGGVMSLVGLARVTAVIALVAAVLATATTGRVMALMTVVAAARDPAKRVATVERPTL